MSKKGAMSSGSGAGRSRAKDQEMAKYLPPAPDRRGKPTEWPYHNNLGTTHKQR